MFEKGDARSLTSRDQPSSRNPLVESGEGHGVLLGQLKQMPICDLFGAQHKSRDSFRAQRIRKQFKADTAAAFQPFEGFHRIRHIALKTCLNTDPDETQLGDGTGSQFFVSTVERGKPPEHSAVLSVSLMGQRNENVHIQKPAHG